MKNQNYFLVLSSFKCIGFLMGTLSCVIAASPSLDEPHGYWERTWNGSATLKRIRDLEAETPKILEPLDSNVRIRDNFHRLAQYVGKLEEERQAFAKELPRLVVAEADLSRCVRDHFKAENGGKGTVDNNEGVISIDASLIRKMQVNIRGMETKCFSSYRSFLQAMPRQEKYDLPHPQRESLVGPSDEGTYGKRIGLFESWIGLKSTQNTISQLRGKLDVRDDVRTRDNLNRVRLQVMDLKKHINGEVDKLEKHRARLACLEDAAVDTDFIISSEMSAHEQMKKIRERFTACLHHRYTF